MQHVALVCVKKFLVGSKNENQNSLPFRLNLHILLSRFDYQKVPREFYDMTILMKVGQNIETLLKLDTCISTTTHGRYAFLCIQVPLEHVTSAKSCILLVLPDKKFNTRVSTYYARLW